MPVTATLSQKFYERFGDDLTNEPVAWLNQVDATYRNDLRELNELNFVRSDARLEQRAAQLEARIGRLATELEAKLDQRTGELRVEIAALRTEFRAELQTAVGRLEGGIGARIAQAENRMVRTLLTYSVAFWLTTLGTVIALLKL